MQVLIFILTLWNLLTYEYNRKRYICITFFHRDLDLRLEELRKS